MLLSAPEGLKLGTWSPRFAFLEAFLVERFQVSLLISIALAECGVCQIACFVRFFKALPQYGSLKTRKQWRFFLYQKARSLPVTLWFFLASTRYPRKHSLGVLDTEVDDLYATIELVAKVGRAMKKSLGADGVVIFNASGAATGQSVAHLHFHVVPCWEDDEVTFWPSEKSAHLVEGEVHELLFAALDE
jgi:hypothetical protein